MHYVCSAFENVSNEKPNKTDIKIYVSKIYLRAQGKSSLHCLILDLKASNDLLLFMALGTKCHILQTK